MPNKPKKTWTIEISYVDRVLGPLYVCPVCMHETKNENHICKWCNAELIKNETYKAKEKTEGIYLDL